MWIFTIAPDWVIHLITAVGLIGLIAATVLGMIPFIRSYRLPLQIVSALVLMLGVYLQGGLADNKEWQLRVKEMEAAIAKAEAEAATKNIEIQEKVVVKTEVVRERGREIVKYLDRIVTKEIPVEVQGPEREKIVEVIKYVENCPIPQPLIDQHNAAAALNAAAKRPEAQK